MTKDELVRENAVLHDEVNELNGRDRYLRNELAKAIRTFGNTETPSWESIFAHIGGLRWSAEANSEKVRMFELERKVTEYERKEAGLL